MSSSAWEPVIGLEIHAQLQSLSKIFSSESAAFGAGDNENVSAVSLGLPGTLPVLNAKVIELGVKTGIALNCEIARSSVFARKNYFYPDLPKGYQISQHEKPLCGSGHVEFWHEGETKKVGITRAHLEEDAGKSIHQGGQTLLNFNRAGVPLLEIVSEPEISSPSEAAEYARSVRRILRYIDVCDGNLEEGSLRCDCNISLRKKGTKALGTKVELKNINSFRFIEKALEYEIHRQIDLLESGQEILQETRLYDSTKNVTSSMRTKEDADDYRYFPDPDLTPIRLSDDYIQSVAMSTPELPLAKAIRFRQEYKLSEEEAFFVTNEKEISEYFEKCAGLCKSPKDAINWIRSDLWRSLNENQISIIDSPIGPNHLADLIQLIVSGKISGKIAKQVFSEMWSSGHAPEKIVVEKGLLQISDESALEEIIKNVVQQNASQADEYRAGKEKVFSFLVGQVMKQTKGRASPDLVNKLLKEALK